LGGGRPIFATMPLPRPASPRALWADLRAFTKERSRIQWIAATLAVLMPVVIIIGFITDARTNIAPGEQLMYVDSWSANRSDAEIMADQKRRQAEREAAQAERQRQFKKLEEQLDF
jgi:hypothetical protein